MTTSQDARQLVRISTDQGEINGDLTVPSDAIGLVIFAHGSGSSRLSPRNRQVADILTRDRLATLLMDLLTAQEERIDEVTAELRFDIPLLAKRVAAARQWVSQQPQLADLPVGYFGASTGAAAALVAATQSPLPVAAIVSRGGRGDLAGQHLANVCSPTLMIVGGDDKVVIELNRKAMNQMHCDKQLVIVAGATHLFEEAGALERVAAHAANWFSTWMTQQQHKAAG